MGSKFIQNSKHPISYETSLNIKEWIVQRFSWNGLLKKYIKSDNDYDKWLYQKFKEILFSNTEMKTIANYDKIESA